MNTLFLLLLWLAWPEEADKALALVPVEEDKQEEETDEAEQRTVEEKLTEKPPPVKLILEPHNGYWLKLKSNDDELEMAEIELKFNHEISIPSDQQFCFEVSNPAIPEDTYTNCQDKIPENRFLVDGLLKGEYRIEARIQEKRGEDEEDEEAVVHRKEVNELHVRAPVEFSPTYEWQTLPRFNSVPQGADVKVDMYSSAGHQVRIPPKWLLRLFVSPIEDKHFRFFFAEVNKDTRLLALRNSLAEFIGLSPPECLEFVFHEEGAEEPVALSTDKSVEGVDWFNRRSSIKVRIDDSATCGFAKCSVGVHNEDNPECEAENKKYYEMYHKGQLKREL